MICPEDDTSPEGARRSRQGWRGLQVAGPLDFALTGVAAALTAPLAEAGVSVLPVATFDTDYLFVRAEALPRAWPRWRRPARNAAGSDGSGTTRTHARQIRPPRPPLASAPVMSTDPRHELGRRGEQLAAEHFERLGYGSSPATTAPASASSTSSSPTRTRSCSARSRRAARARARRGTRSARRSEPGPEHGPWPGCREAQRPAADLGAPLRRGRRRPRRPTAPSSRSTTRGRAF